MLPTQAIARSCHTLLAHNAAETTDCAGKLDFVCEHRLGHAKSILLIGKPDVKP